MEIRSGILKGVQTDTGMVFKGIPYAENPFTGSLRFMAPQPVRPWKGVYDASRFRQTPQPGRGRPVESIGEAGHLTLNVWTPDKTAKGLPVMVWLPGGAFVRADASEQVYDGASFAANGIVTVTVNYRVGVDGFMQIEGAPANRGILDQIAALEWVQENINAFGGDPTKVTIFGQSAGAGCIAVLMGLPQANGLFKQAILQSPPMQWLSRAEADELALTFAGSLSVEPTIAGLASIPLDRLVKKQAGLAQVLSDHSAWGRLAWGGTAFLPVVDGELLRKTPMECLTEPEIDRSRPIIVGSTDEESRLYLVPSGELEQISEDKVNSFLKYLNLPGDAMQVYADGKSIGDAYAALMSDYTFRMPALKITELMAANKKTWHYNFSWKSPACDNKLGAAHFVDVPFTFKTLHAPQAKFFTGNTPPEALSDAMHSAWCSFAKTGNPGWPAYNLLERQTMCWDIANGLVNDPQPEKRKLWRNFEF